MSLIAIGQFSGMAPRFANHLLRDTQASYAANLKTSSGALRGFRATALVADFNPTAKIYRRALRLFYPASDTFEWWLNEDVNSSVIQSPLTNDAFNRVYWTDKYHTAPQMATLATLDTPGSYRNLGMARPTLQPGVAHTGGTGATSVRAYTYVWVSDYGEESPPAPARVVTGKIDDTWTITVPAAGPPHTVRTDIYRTVTGNTTSGAFYRVGSVTIGTTSFVDSMAIDIVPLQPILKSLDNDPPPPGLQGIVTHSSGAVAGFVGKDVYFSVPYLPHAWPGATKYSVPFEITRLAAIGNSVIVMTKGFPVALTGTRPDGMSINNMVDAEPCVSPRSTVVYDNTVFYASPNGLASIGADGYDRPINALVTREEWPQFQPGTFVAAMYGSFYIAFHDPFSGVAIALPPYEDASLIVLDRFRNVTGVETDSRTGDLHMLQGQTVERFDATVDSRFQTTWKSKLFVLPKPMNMGAYQVIFGANQDDVTFAEILTELREYNEERFALGPLDTLNMLTLAGQPVPSPDIDTPPMWPGVPPRASLGGQPMYDLDQIIRGHGVRFTLIADDATIYSRVVTDQNVHKLPSGKKYTKIYLELVGSVEVQKVVVAETARECRNA